MTSSFRQRDPYAMGSTNYLATGADLSEAMIKEQNNQIEDTKEFYNQMAELEKQRAERPLKLLGEIADFAQSAAPIFKQIQQANEDRNTEQQFEQDAKKNSQDPTKSKEERNAAFDATMIFGEGSFTYQGNSITPTVSF